MIKASDLDLLLAKVFDDLRSDLRKELGDRGRMDDYEKLKNDFIFHVSDWLEDLKRLHALEEAPDAWKAAHAAKFLVGFLYHVIPHLKAAGRLLLDEVPDPFAEDESARLLEKLRQPGPTGR